MKEIIGGLGFLKEFVGRIIRLNHHKSQTLSVAPACGKKLSQGTCFDRILLARHQHRQHSHRVSVRGTVESCTILESA